MRRNRKKWITWMAAAVLCVGIAGMAVSMQVSAADAAAGQDDSNEVVVVRTTQRCSIWSAPATADENRTKYVDEGYQIQVYPQPIASELPDGKTFYRTVRGAYVLCRCVAEAEAPSADTIRVGSYKGTVLDTGEVSSLIIYPDAGNCAAVSNAPDVASVSQVLGRWTVTAKGPGTAVITVTAPDGRTGSVTINVASAAPAADAGGGNESAGQASNMEIRQEMIRLINETRRINGVAELPVSDALMSAAQVCSDRRYTWHHTQEECQAVAATGYPYGFGDNLTVFTGTDNAARRAVDNWIGSRGHFLTMIDPDCDCIGVGVTQYDGITYCYMFVGKPGSVSFY